MRLPHRKLEALAGLIAPETGRKLAELAAAVPGDQAIVELGAYKGKSTCYLACGARAGNGAHVWTFDAWDLPGNESGRHGYAEPSVRATFDAQVKSLDLQEHITATRMRSTAAGATWGGPRVGLLFIDASHLLEDVRADFYAWVPHLADDALVVFDDYDTPKNPGVKRFVDDLAAADIGPDLSTPPLAILRRTQR